MTERPNPSSKERERRSTESESASEAEAASEKRAGQDKVVLKSLNSLERLRDRVETAAHELKRLRDENQALSERIKELESRPHVDKHGTYLSLDHDPEILRRKISGFIESIDQYLEKERKSS